MRWQESRASRRGPRKHQSSGNTEAVAEWPCGTPQWRTELKRIRCDTPTCRLVAWWNSNPRHFALGARRLDGGEGGEDPPHLRTLLTEDCIEAAHRGPNTHRRWWPPPPCTLCTPLWFATPRIASNLLQGDTAVWQGHQKTHSEPVQKSCALQFPSTHSKKFLHKG